jgi:protein SCO1/2
MSAARLLLRVACIALGGVLLFVAGWRLATVRAHRAAGSPLVALPTDYGAVAPFSFKDQTGQTVTLDTLKGKAWVADFIFTRCAGPCPLLTSQMKELAREFAAKKDLVWVSFTVDPDYDTPPVLKKYAARVGADNARWKFLTGPKDQVYALIRQSFHLAAEPLQVTETGEVDIMHSLYFVLVNPEGRISGVYDSSDAPSVNRLKAELARLP